MIRPDMYGPLSLMVTVMDLPVRWFTTRTTEPKGSVLWAAVMALGFIRSPFAVRCPGKEYQEAVPH